MGKIEHLNTYTLHSQQERDTHSNQQQGLKKPPNRRKLVCKKEEHKNPNIVNILYTANVTYLTYRFQNVYQQLIK